MAPIYEHPIAALNGIRGKSGDGNPAKNSGSGRVVQFLVEIIEIIE